MSSITFDSKLMTPLSNFVLPTIQFKRVVLPHPLGPNRPYLKIILISISHILVLYYAIDVK